MIIFLALLTITLLLIIILPSNKLEEDVES